MASIKNLVSSEISHSQIFRQCDMYVFSGGYRTCSRCCRRNIDQGRRQISSKKSVTPDWNENRNLKYSIAEIYKNKATFIMQKVLYLLYPLAGSNRNSLAHCLIEIVYQTILRYRNQNI